MKWPRLRMLSLLLAGLLMSVVAPQGVGQPVETPRAFAMRFVAVDVYIDSGDARLGAWQIEYVGGSGQEDRVMLVGVEGGEHPAYTTAPHYDPAALDGGRVIIAAYTTAADSPSGQSRVARLHLSVPGGAEVTHTVRLIAAGDSEGVRIAPRVWVSEFSPDIIKNNDSDTEDEGSQP